MQSRRNQVVSILAVAILTICAVVQLREVLQIVRSSWSDLYPQWKASQAAVHHEDPYSRSVTDQIQLGFYGHVLRPHEPADQQNFVYPAHLVLFLAPLTFLPWTVVRPVFAVAAPIVLACTLWLWISLSGLKFSRDRLILLYGLVVTSWPAIWAYQQQQPTIFIFAAFSLALFCFAHQRDVIAGALLAMTTVKPNLVLLMAVWLAVDALFTRRWKFIGSLTVTGLVLLAASELLVPGWIHEWIHATSVYAHEPLKLSLLGHIFGKRPGYLIAAIFLIVAGVRLAVRKLNLFESAAVLLSISVCIMPTTKWMVYNNLLLIPAALLLIVVPAQNRVKRVLRFLGRCALSWLAFVAPIAVLILVILRGHFRMLPFCEMNTVFCVTACTLALADRGVIPYLSEAHPSYLAPAGPSPLLASS